MRETSYYECEVVTVPPHGTAAEIADALERHAVGCVIVVDDAGGPLGIITDRDLLRRVVAPGAHGEKVLAQDIMSAELVTAAPTDTLELDLERMRKHRIRRLPIVRDGRLSGIVTLDDLLVDVSTELDLLRETLRNEILRSRQGARRLRRREDLETAVEELRSQLSGLGGQTRSWLHKEIEALRLRLGGEEEDDSEA